MSYVSNNRETVKAKLKRQLEAAQQIADAYAGSGPLAELRAHDDWDREDSNGFLWHDIDGVTPMPDGMLMPCPYCRVRKLKRELELSLYRSAPHGQVH